MRMNTKNTSLTYFPQRLIFRHVAGGGGGGGALPPLLCLAANIFKKLTYRKLNYKGVAPIPTNFMRAYKKM